MKTLNRILLLVALLLLPMLSHALLARLYRVSVLLVWCFRSAAPSKCVVRYA